MTKIHHMKLLFLATRGNHMYDFVPYYYGPYSFELYNDFRSLMRDGIISEEDATPGSGNKDVWALKEEWVVPKPDPGVQRIINSVFNTYNSMKESDLIKFVYDKYPEYSVNSKLTNYKHVIQKQQETGIVTIGYEGKNFDKFIDQLIQNNVDILVDVRRNAYSMKYGFSKYQLVKTFDSFQKESIITKISYIHMPELGIPSEKRKGKTLSEYGEMFKEYETGLNELSKYLDQLIALSKTHKIALMCFEADVSYCHRGIIAKRLREMGCPVMDI